MAYSSKTPKLAYLSEQLLRPEHEIIAFRHHQPLLVGDLKQQVLLICHSLVHCPQKYWALSMQDSFNFVAGLLALLYLGKHPRLLDPCHQEMQHFYEAILTDDKTIYQNQYDNQQIIDINSLNSNNLTYDYNLLDNGFIQKTFTLFTSGSTGLPKPIEKSVSQLEQESLVLLSYWGELSSDLFVAAVSHEHMYGLTFKIMLALSCKIPFVCEKIIYQEQFTAYKHKKLIYITTPSIIKNLDDKLPAIKCDKVISSGGKLTYAEAQLCQHNFTVLPNEIYGSSETGIIAIRQQKQPDMPWQLFAPMHIKMEESQPALFFSPLLDKPQPLDDKIRLVNSRSFYLDGRLDKIIKISEKRVSLTYIENKFNQLNQVEQAYVIPLEHNNRTILGIIIKLNHSGQQQLQHEGTFKLSQYFRQSLKDTLSLSEMPKKWRFINDFPKNTQGKCTYIELKKLFEVTKMSKILPEEITLNINQHQADIELNIPPDLFWFKGHFVSQPLLPGVAQLNWVIYYAQKFFNANLALSSVEVIKFQCPILPEDHLLLHIEWNTQTQKLLFSYTFITPENINKVASSGKLTLCQ
ncbi:ApeI family dehydratase [Gilliamella sp. wkB112]|uniref:ApeI family dehydratase n=1 Tax=Gilliamella sp. wkB112 TaxID=3120257 RepID=UPI00080DE209|nr:AMP-binding protein [Gilliamella apicola]OCG02247.1 hypothetical protein A9G12_11090 [Gilliamella apicola]